MPNYSQKNNNEKHLHLFTAEEHHIDIFTDSTASVYLICSFNLRRITHQSAE